MGGEMVSVRFFIDPETGEPHCLAHGVTAEEAAEAFFDRVEDCRGRQGARIAIGKTLGGRILKVIYSPERAEVFIITAYSLAGKELKAFRRRQK